jgi:hypothetical protein
VSGRGHQRASKASGKAKPKPKRTKPRAEPDVPDLLAWAREEVATCQGLIEKSHKYLGEQLEKAVGEDGNVNDVLRILKALEGRQDRALVLEERLAAREMAARPELAAGSRRARGFLGSLEAVKAVSKAERETA